MEQHSSWLAVAGLMGGIAVLAGAFGAHGLEGRVTEARLDTFEIAVRYQMYHTLALLMVTLLHSHISSDLFSYVKIGFLIGTIIFSGSLYLLVLTDTAWLGAITPIGGLILVMSWLLLAYVGFIGD